MNQGQYRKYLKHLEESYLQDEIGYEEYLERKDCLDSAAIDSAENLVKEFPENYQGSY